MLVMMRLHFLLTLSLLAFGCQGLVLRQFAFRSSVPSVGLDLDSDHKSSIDEILHRKQDKTLEAVHPDRLRKRAFQPPLLDYVWSHLTDMPRYERIRSLHNLLDNFQRTEQRLDASDLQRLAQIEAFRRNLGEAASILQYRSFHEDEHIVNHMFHANKKFYLVSPEHKVMMLAVPDASGFTKYSVTSHDEELLYRYIQLARTLDVNL